MKTIILTSLLLCSSLALTSLAGTVKIPSDEPVATVSIPDSWEPEEDEDGGVLAESPDNVTTLYFEAVDNDKDMKAVVEGSLEWLTEEHEVKIDPKTQSEKEFTVGDRKWSRISWEGTSKEWGAAVIGFLFTEVGDGHVLTVTYWVSKENTEKSLVALDKVLSSVKNAE